MKIHSRIFIFFLLIPGSVFSQEAVKEKKQPGSSYVSNSRDTFQMPYNRLIHSAGQVITYGDSSLENHALDLCLLPDKRNIVVEDRYGIAILDTKSKSLVERWKFSSEAQLRDLVSSYSGITSFVFHQKTFIAWGASSAGEHGAIVIAEWNGEKIDAVTEINISSDGPLHKSIPNQIVANTEDGQLYLYAVLNGDNQLIKIKFDDRSEVWSASTGVAPYGICIINKKAYVTNWGGPMATDTSREMAGTPDDLAYTNPATGGTMPGSLSVIDIASGKSLNELMLGIHPTTIIKSPDNHLLYITNGNSDNVSVVNVDQGVVVDSIETGLFSKQYGYYGSSPDALLIDSSANSLYVANGMDNAIAVYKLGGQNSATTKSAAGFLGYIPTEAYPSGIVQANGYLYITNLESRGAKVLSRANELSGLKDAPTAYTIHKELTSVSIIPVPGDHQLDSLTEEVKELNLFNRAAISTSPPRPNILPVPIPERIGEPSLFKHVVYIIKENKTYDQVFGDIKKGQGEEDLCIYPEKVTPNQHQLAADFCLLDNFFVSGKSSAEGHQWADAALVSDYIERSVRAWFRSYPHRQEDAMVYNKAGFIWNNVLDHGKTVRIFGEACLTHYDNTLQWLDIYNKYVNHEPLNMLNTTTIKRIRPYIVRDYPDCANIILNDQMRADVFIREWKKIEEHGGTLPDLMILSLPNDHTAGMSPNFPTPKAMVADNDLALGRIIEAISHSRFWDSTVVFVTEDDSQSGWDHLSPYRTVCQVISSYSNLGKTIHTNYNQTSMVRTIEQILGIPPMNVIDATALPMFDCFENKKKDYHYQQIPNKIPLNDMNRPLSQLQGKSRYYARLSAEKAFKDVDGGDDKLMNMILWFDAKGDQQYPGTR